MVHCVIISYIKQLLVKEVVLKLESFNFVPFAGVFVLESETYVVYLNFSLKIFVAEVFFAL